MRCTVSSRVSRQRSARSLSNAGFIKDPVVAAGAAGEAGTEVVLLMVRVVMPVKTGVIGVAVLLLLSAPSAAALLLEGGGVALMDDCRVILIEEP